jgi:transposase
LPNGHDTIFHHEIKEINAMMGYQEPSQENLFMYGINLETRVRMDHPLRRMKECIDFDFMYKEVEEKYGKNGNVSIPPPVILKLMLLLVFYNVRSERELMETLPERLDWLWFLGYTLTSSVPDHSVLSKARKRWGEEAFKHFFERIVIQCVEAKLVDGTKIFMDGSLIDADASNNSVVDSHSLKRYLNRGYQELEKRLDESTEPDNKPSVNTRYVSTTDPDASIVRQGKGKPKLRYKTHRAVDGRHEIVTAVKVTPGAVDEGHEMTSLIEAHEANTDAKVAVVVADSQYGTKENLLACHDKGIKTHMPVIKVLYEHTGSRKGIFPAERFVYDKEADTYTCPQGKRLTKRHVYEEKGNVEYSAAKKDCGGCSLRPHCTRSTGPRTVQRHLRQEELDCMIIIAQSDHAKKDLKTRKHLMERSWARSTRYRFDRARWRGLWKVAIQEYFIAAIQNIQTLLRYGRQSGQTVLTLVPGQTLQRAALHLYHLRRLLLRSCESAKRIIHRDPDATKGVRVELQVDTPIRVCFGQQAVKI